MMSRHGRVSERYTAVAIVLHWAIAAAIIGNIFIGWWMTDAITVQATQAKAVTAFQLHKSIGFTVLVLSVIRLGWRMTHPAPRLPQDMATWERVGAHGAHWALYALMIGLPLTGWIYVSTGWSTPNDQALEVPSLFFGLFEIPHILGLDHATEATRRAVASASLFSHENLARAVIFVLLPLHVLGALKHHFKNRDDVLSRMVPGLNAPGQPAPPRSLGRLLIVGTGLAAVVFGIIASVFALTAKPANPGRSSAPAAQVGSNAALDSLPSVQCAAGSTTWRVDPAKSEIAFTGSHAGADFRGRFSQWRADICFDPDNLDQSIATVTVNTASAADGVPLHDRSLPGEEWFDVENHPNATFKTTAFERSASGDAYVATGTLTIKGKEIPLTLPFTLTIDGAKATMATSLTLDRVTTDLGLTSDPNADWVSNEIGVEVRVAASSDAT